MSGQHLVQVVQDRKTITNRLHFDIKASGDWSLPFKVRKERVHAEAKRLIALGATLVDPLEDEDEDGTGPYAVALRDPEGNEFDIN